MKLLHAGDKSKAICHHCNALVHTTYQRRDIPFSDGVGIATDILAGVCDVCDRVVSTPAGTLTDLAKAQPRADILSKQPLARPSHHVRTFLSLNPHIRTRRLLLSHTRSSITVAFGPFYHLHNPYSSAFSPATVYHLQGMF